MFSVVIIEDGKEVERRGSCEYDPGEGWSGVIYMINATIHYQAKTFSLLGEAFAEAIDDWIDYKKESE